MSSSASQRVDAHAVPAGKRTASALGHMQVSNEDSYSTKFRVGEVDLETLANEASGANDVLLLVCGDMLALYAPNEPSQLSDRAL